MMIGLYPRNNHANPMADHDRNIFCQSKDRRTDRNILIDVHFFLTLGFILCHCVIYMYGCHSFYNALILCIFLTYKAYDLIAKMGFFKKKTHHGFS